MTHEGGGLLGTVVYDPFCGRGTAPFQALLMNRRAIGNDINAVAYCVTKAKTNAPDLEHVEQRLDLLEAGFDMARWEDAASSHLSSSLTRLPPKRSSNFCIYGIAFTGARLTSIA